MVKGMEKERIRRIEFVSLLVEFLGQNCFAFLKIKMVHIALLKYLTFLNRFVREKGTVKLKKLISC